MRPLSDAQQARTSATITRPGYLVELNFSTPLRYSTLGNVHWAGKVFTGRALLTVTGLSSGMGNAPRIAVGNLDGGLGQVLLAEGAQNVGINVWSFYADAGAETFLLADGLGASVALPVPEFSGVVDSVDIGDVVSFACAVDAAKNTKLPRRFMTAESGFFRLRAAGEVIAQEGGWEIVLKGRETA